MLCTAVRNMIMSVTGMCIDVLPSLRPSQMDVTFVKD